MWNRLSPEIALPARGAKIVPEGTHRCAPETPEPPLRKITPGRHFIPPPDASKMHDVVGHVFGAHNHRQPGSICKGGEANFQFRCTLHHKHPRPGHLRRVERLVRRLSDQFFDSVVRLIERILGASPCFPDRLCH